MSDDVLVGIIANPASGKDIRRLVAHGSSFDNNEKISIARRILHGLAATGVRNVAYLPDTYGIVARAAATPDIGLNANPLAMPIVDNAGDSTEAANRLRDLGANVIVTLGGDGTNRAVAKGCGDVPLVPVSTGTNNVFPRMVEGTLAGMAAGLVAIGVARNRPGAPRVIRRAPRLDILLHGQPVDIALVDVVSATPRWIGARALWEPSHLREIVLSHINPGAIGVASIGAALFPTACTGCSGAWAALGSPESSSTAVSVPLAPGLFGELHVTDAKLLGPGEAVQLAAGPCTLALDGEREIEIHAAETQIAVRLEPLGPRVVDVQAALTAGAAAGAFVRGQSLFVSPA